eukprot:CAMPEP_0174281064 /NCGR_PEP_ID=MMETSP0809-20121228/1373_1 /TAXON_ID=73025 ORGANISM="Eutreptiella gymnastica-like, Strain CCMP1594" /NCGR_SAMPLE_ID=MMETSP0809 /ASSEMBLY_ACC=CAM_ASM_000658 /LENGTH=30 /DNA_ID= /DNA_START= /DNA_END= /DNA_ORIENTATION=
MDTLPWQLANEGAYAHYARSARPSEQPSQM